MKSIFDEIHYVNNYHIRYMFDSFIGQFVHIFSYYIIYLNYIYLCHTALGKIRRRHRYFHNKSDQAFQWINFPSLSVIMNGKASKTCPLWNDLNTFQDSKGVLSICLNHLSIIHSPYFNEKNFSIYQICYINYHTIHTLRFH